MVALGLHSRTAEIFLSRHRRRRRLAGFAPAQTRQGQRRQGDRTCRCRPRSSACRGRERQESRQVRFASKTCSSSTNFPSKSVMRSSTWSTCSKADSSSPASKRCAVSSPCNSALSFRRIHITDNVRLKPREYVISLRGVEIARWEMLEDRVLAISSELNPPALAGTRHPRACLRRRRPLDRPRPRIPGLDFRLCRRRSDFGALYPPRRNHPPARLRIADPRRRPSGCSIASRRATPSWSKNWFRNS